VELSLFGPYIITILGVPTKNVITVLSTANMAVLVFFPLCMHSLSFSLNKLSFEAYQTEIGQPKSHLSTAN